MSTRMPATLRLATRGACCAVVISSGLLAGGCDFLYTPGEGATPQGETGDAPVHVRGYGDRYQSEGLADRFDAIRTTSDGGYVVVGTGGGVPHIDEPLDESLSNKIWAIRTNSDGSVSWQYRYGQHDSMSGQLVSATANDLELTSGEGFLVAGRVGSHALVIKLNGNGSIAWQWSRHEEGALNEAIAIDVTADGLILVTGASGRRPDRPELLERDTWVTVLDANGVSVPNSTQLVFAGGMPHAMVATNDDGFIVAGGAYAANSDTAHRNWVARYRREAGAGFRLTWTKTYGTAVAGEFHSITRSGDRFVLGGTSPRGPLVYELAADGNVVAAHELRTPDGEPTPSQIVREINAILQTGDGYLLTGTYGPEQYAGFAWAAHLVLGAGATRTIRWQRCYVGPRWSDTHDPGTAATAIDRGANGGYRIAGRLASFTDHGGGTYSDSHYGWVAALDTDGLIDVNPLSGVYMLPTSLVPVEVTGLLLVNDYGPAPTAIPDHGGNEFLVLAQPTNAVIETMSAPAGALNSPSTGTNNPGHSFYWSSVSEASGYLVFRSRDDVSYDRGETWFLSGHDYRGGSLRSLDDARFFKLVAFNAAGYSGFSNAVDLEDGEPLPGPITLNVSVAGGDGSVESSPPGIRCPTQCSQSFGSSTGGTQVSLTALETDISEFVSWQGCDSIAGPRCTLVMTDTSRSVTANFRPKSPTTPN